jgi:hypothetical protein
MRNFSLDGGVNPGYPKYEAGVLICGPRGKLCLRYETEHCMAWNLLATNVVCYV